MSKQNTEKPFTIIPHPIPNRGLRFVDHHKNGRSGHGGQCITQCKNGDILCFYSNVSGEIWHGHGVSGYTEYKRSSDGGKTWSDPISFDYSKSMWLSNEVYSAIVFAVNTADDGTVIAFMCRFASTDWVKQDVPVYCLSHDHGQTWSEPKRIDSHSTVQDASLTFDAILVHKGIVHVVFMGGAANYCPGPYHMYSSTDHGHTFSKTSRLPFDHGNYYVTLGTTKDDELIVYSYPYQKEKTDEHNMHYTISNDEGKNWSCVSTSHFAKKIRNPQLSEPIDGYWFLHGRSGSYGAERGHLVLYTSEDGIHWDEGIILYKKMGSGGDCYSANARIVTHDQKKLLIQSSISYDGSKVDEKHWWIQFL